MKPIELLSPVGDFECLKAAVQNGADAVYLGASSFSARASATNFDLSGLKDAIDYAKLRGVKVHLALNTLIKNDELNDAIELAKSAYEFGIDALIVQDYGLCSILRKHFPNLPIHASTQMSIHNLEGVEQLKSLGFSRVILSRELSLNELGFIKSNSDIELEVFIHGALCISYSGQCLLSSMIGGRSGNRGKCGQACRLPYNLISKSDKEICMDKGYILSPKDLCGLSFIPDLIKTGISSLKIEGRMKTPEYVATVTRIYRKYIDLAYLDKDYIVKEQDLKDLLQVFNRGGFSNGHLSHTPNQKLVFKEKSNNMGIYIGNVANYNASKGYITLNLNDKLAIGDTISLEKETGKYNVSELMINKKNIDCANTGEVVTIGRMKGNISPGDKIYKLESKTLIQLAKKSYNIDNKKINLDCSIFIKKDSPIYIKVSGPENLDLTIDSEILPSSAINNPITKERIISQFSKTGNTPFQFTEIEVNLDSDMYVNISDLNELRRYTLQKVQEKLISSYERSLNTGLPSVSFNTNLKKIGYKKVSLLLNILDINYNYSELENVDCIYIPLKYFVKTEYSNILKNLTTSFDTYIYMPNIIKPNYRNLLTNNIDKALSEYDIKGFVLSNISNIKILEKYKDHYEFIGNYTLNILNNLAIEAYSNLGISNITLSPELDKENIIKIASNSKTKTELVVYGNTPVMTTGYCIFGKSNKCYPNCKALCKSKNVYYLKDRIGFYFRVIADNVQTINTVYNSKITSINHSDLPVNVVRIDILDENILEINNIINIVKSGQRLDGKDYTNGNFIREI